MAEVGIDDAGVDSAAEVAAAGVLFLLLLGLLAAEVGTAALSLHDLDERVDDGGGAGDLGGGCCS